MSIIYDALKKIEKKIEAAPRKDQEAKSVKKSKRPLGAYLAYAFVVCVGILIGNMVFGSFRQKVKAGYAPSVKLPPLASSPAGTRPLAQLPETILAPATADPGSAKKQNKAPAAPILTLNGVFFSDDGGYALINNRIVREGDTIEGIKIVRISSEEVELDNNGTPLKLPTGE